MALEKFRAAEGEFQKAEAAEQKRQKRLDREYHRAARKFHHDLHEFSTIAIRRFNLGSKGGFAFLSSFDACDVKEVLTLLIPQKNEKNYMEVRETRKTGSHKLELFVGVQRAEVASGWGITVRSEAQPLLPVEIEVEADANCTPRDEVLEAIGKINGIKNVNSGKTYSLTIARSLLDLVSTAGIDQLHSIMPAKQ